MVNTRLLDDATPLRLAAGSRTSSVTLTGGVNGTLNLCDATSGNITVTLTATSAAGHVFIIKKTDASANTVTVSAANIDGASTYVLTARYQSVTVATTFTSGTWAILAKTP